MDTAPITDPVQSAASAAQAAAAASSSKPQTLGKDQFLQLLIAQLENQDPMSPTDDKEFVAQMATFSSLEQLIDVNSNLQGLAAGQGNLINAQALGLIGKQALVTGGDQVRLKAGKPDTLVYALPEPAREATLTVYAADGTPVKVFTFFLSRAIITNIQLLHEFQRCPVNVFHRHTHHATKIDGTFAQPAGTAVHRLLHHACPRTERPGGALVGGPKNRHHGQSQRGRQVHRT